MKLEVTMPKSDLIQMAKDHIAKIIPVDRFAAVDVRMKDYEEHLTVTLKDQAELDAEAALAERLRKYREEQDAKNRAVEEAVAEPALVGV